MLSGKRVKVIEKSVEKSVDKPVDIPVEDGAKKDVEVLTCKSLAVAVYKNPSTGSARVGQIGLGSRVAVIARDGDWVRITKPDGWVPAAFLG